MRNNFNKGQAYKWGARSKGVLDTLHPLLKLLMNAALKRYDLGLVEGLRGEATQNSYYDYGNTKVKFPFSKHNRTLDPQLKDIMYEVSDAVDIIPATGYRKPINMVLVAGYINALADQMGIMIRWGGDWNMDGDVNNGKGEFFDCWHLELIHE